MRALYFKTQDILHFGLFVVLALVALFASTVLAQTNPEINYQGKLTDATGQAVPDGTYNMRFYIYNATGGATTSAIWTESLVGGNQVQVTNGLFSVMLGSTTALTSVDFNQTLYLGVEIGGTGAPAWDGEMSPRKILGTVPAAFVARTALTAEDAFLLGGVASTSFLRSDTADTLIAATANTLLTIQQNGIGDILNLYDGSTEVFTVTDGGLVGIGTATTSRLLNIGGTSNAGVRITDTTNTVQTEIRSEDFQGFIGTFSNHDLRFVTNNTSRGVITNAGNWGIGTTSATARLTVQGDIRLTGALRDGGDDTGTSGQVLLATGTSTNWVATSSLGFGTSFVSTLNDLTDVNIGVPTIGELFSYNGSQWANVATSSLNIVLADTIGTLDVTRGGTGLTSYATGDIVYASGANTLANRTIGSTGDVFQVLGGIPTWSATSSLGFRESLFTDGGVTSYLTSLSDGLAIGTTSASNNVKLDVWGDFRVGTGSVPALFADVSAGTIGIGTTTPTSRLTVAGGDVTISDGTPGLYLRSTNTFMRTLSIYTDGGMGYLMHENGVLNIGSNSETILTISPSADNMVSFKSDVAIGTTTLTAANDVGSLIVQSRDSNNIASFFNQDGEEIFSFLGNGNLGIGTTTPISRLSVTGNTTLDGNLRVTGTFIDSAGATGANGQVLQTTGTGTVWVATSSLGFASAGSAHDAVTVAGENYLSLSGQQITATAIDLSGSNATGILAAARFPALTGDITTSAASLITTLANDTIDFANIDYSALIASNPIFGANETFFGTTGVIFEGSVADTFEGLLTAVNPTADRTWTLPNVSGTLITSGDTGTVNTTLLGDNQVNLADINYGNTLASNPVFLVDECYFTTTTSGGGFICEGSAADTNEQLYLFPDVNGADTTQTIALTDSAMTGTFDGNDFAGGAVAMGDLLYGSGAGTIAELGIGANGRVLQVVGGLPAWVATSTLGFAAAGSGITTFLGLTDTPVNYTINGAIPYESSDTLTFSSGFTFDGTDLLLGSAGAYRIGSNDVLSVGISGNSFFLAGATSGSAGATDTNNYAIGLGALASLNNSGGDGNIAFGSGAAGAIDFGSDNIAIGRSALTTLTASSRNISIGALSGQQILSGSDNVVIGHDADISASSGARNVVVGVASGGGNSDNIVLGSNTTLGSVSGNIFVGSNMEAGSDNNNFLNIGNLLFGTGIDGTGTTLSSGNIGIGTTTPGAKLDVWGGLRVGTSSTPTLVVNSANGRVGIGIANPNAELEVIGDVKATGLLWAAGGSSGTRRVARYENFDDAASASGVDFGVKLGNSEFQGISWVKESAWTNASAASAKDATLQLGVLANNNGLNALVINSLGNVGIGTTSPVARLSLERTGVTGAGVIGLDQYLQTTNSTLSAVQFGNRMFLDAAQTATTTLVGSILRVRDNSVLGNTIRGFEVQTDRGTNTQGENTALSGFARTFGVRGTTRGDAGGTFEPAGGFFETQGTTQGNAIRGFSQTITTAALLSLFQASSTFAGTGLEMNFGNTTGSFASTSSRFIDFQNAGTSVFVVSAFGTTTIGDGVTQAGLQIPNGGICVDDDGFCTASTSGRITARDFQGGNSDLAEIYFSNQSLAFGEVVSLVEGLSVTRATPETKRTVLGVVSTAPGLVMGADDTSLRDDETAYPIALAGRVPIRLSNENGPITAGDELTLSSLPGVAMKATSSGQIIGVALEDFDETRAYSDTYINQYADNIIVPEFVPVTSLRDPRIADGCFMGGGSEVGDAPCVPLVATTSEAQVREAHALASAAAREKELRRLARQSSERVVVATDREVQVGQIVMFVDLRYRYVGVAEETMLASLMMHASEVDQQSLLATDTIWSRLVQLATGFVDGVLSLTGITVERVETNTLCIDDVCVTADDLRILLQQSNADEQVVEVMVPTVMPDEYVETEVYVNTDVNTYGDEQTSSTSTTTPIATSSPDATLSTSTDMHIATTTIISNDSDEITTTSDPIPDLVTTDEVDLVDSPDEDTNDRVDVLDLSPGDTDESRTEPPPVEPEPEPVEQVPAPEVIIIAPNN